MTIRRTRFSGVFVTLTTSCTLVIPLMMGGCAEFLSGSSQQYFFSAVEKSITMTATPTTTPTSVGNAACTSFGNDSTSSNTTSSNGILSTLSYLNSRTSYPSPTPTLIPLGSLNSTFFNGSTPTSQPYITWVTQNGSNLNLILSQVNTPPQSYSSGFAYAGSDGVTHSIKDGNGNVLYEYFALHIDSNIGLSDTDAVGTYQFGVMADDGAILSLNPSPTPSASSSPTLTPWVDNDGQHGAKFQCASNLVTFDHRSRIPIHIDYYQGPATYLGLVLMWRKVNTADTGFNSSGCAQQVDFEATSTPYKWLLGSASSSVISSSPITYPWVVLPAANFYLNTDTSNPCNP